MATERAPGLSPEDAIFFTLFLAQVLLLHLPLFVWPLRATPILLIFVKKTPHATSMGWHGEAPAHTESVGHAEEEGGNGEGCFGRAISGSILAKATKQEVPHTKEHHERWAKEAWKGDLKEGGGEGRGEGDFFGKQLWLMSTPPFTNSQRRRLLEEIMESYRLRTADKCLSHTSGM